jgi:hypothetical protein
LARPRVFASRFACRPRLVCELCLFVWPTLDLSVCPQPFGSLSACLRSMLRRSFFSPSASIRECHPRCQTCPRCPRGPGGRPGKIQSQFCESRCRSRAPHPRVHKKASTSFRNGQEKKRGIPTLSSKDRPSPGPRREERRTAGIIIDGRMLFLLPPTKSLTPDLRSGVSFLERPRISRPPFGRRPFRPGAPRTRHSVRIPNPRKTQ